MDRFQSFSPTVYSYRQKVMTQSLLRVGRMQAQISGTTTGHLSSTFLVTKREPGGGISNWPTLLCLFQVINAAALLLLLLLEQPEQLEQYVPLDSCGSAASCIPSRIVCTSALVRDDVDTGRRYR